MEFEARMFKDFPAKAKIVRKFLSWTATETVATPYRILDVGCGKGHFVEELRRSGFHSEGIDLSSTAIESAQKERGLTGLRSGELEEQRDWNNRFDAITVWATLEHLPDPCGLLKAIQKALKPGGYLFLDTGLAGDFVDRWAPGLIQWFDPPQHLFVFSRRGLEILLGDHGFVVELFEENFERSGVRRAMKYVRNRFLSLVGTALFRFLLGGPAFTRMRMESKMPFGSLALVVARSELRT